MVSSVLPQETRQSPVLALVVQGGNSAAYSSRSIQTILGARQPRQMPCGSVTQLPASAPGQLPDRRKKYTTSASGPSFTSPLTGIDRPVFDRNSLTGRLDFSSQVFSGAQSGRGPI
jgi:hypothetical protein